jgi:geranylgeranyl transferase type-1 subunit beta
MPAAQLPGLADFPGMISWLVARQTEYSDEDEYDEATDVKKHATLSREQYEILTKAYGNSAEAVDLAELTVLQSDCVGFNGRCNKKADTCYAFWVGASLDVCGPLRERGLLLIVYSCLVRKSS